MSCHFPRPVPYAPLKDNWETFRFIDKELQSSLIRRIREAGLVHKIAEDGAVLYLNGSSIEKLINQVVETVFTGSYYRTEISDPIKADRYRRFKSFTGTPLIEEIHRGRTYFTQEIYEKLYRYRGRPTHVSFILSGEDLDPNKITALLKISPTFACFKGEPFARPYTGRRKDVPFPLSITGWWEICSIPHLESNNITSHLEWLFSLLEPVASKVKALTEEATNIDFRCLQVDIVKSRRSLSGVSLPGSTLERLSLLCDRVDIRFWSDDYI